MPLSLSVRDLACVRGGRLVFQDVSFSLETGDALLLRGPNGSGKSSLLRVLAGFLEAAAGSVEWGTAAVSAGLRSDSENVAKSPSPMNFRTCPPFD